MTRIKQIPIKDIPPSGNDDAIILGQDKNVRDLLEMFFRSPKNRIGYIVDERDRLIGVVKLNDIIELITPYFQMLDDTNLKKCMGELGNKPIRDIMQKNFLFLKETTPVSAAVIFMLRDQLNESPVVDDEGKIKGTVDFLDFMKVFQKPRAQLVKNGQSQ